MAKEKLFVGLESTNIEKFQSPCCGIGLSIEPLSRIACGECGKIVREEDAVYVPSACETGRIQSIKPNESAKPREISGFKDLPILLLKDKIEYYRGRQKESVDKKNVKEFEKYASIIIILYEATRLLENKEKPNLKLADTYDLFDELKKRIK